MSTTPTRIGAPMHVPAGLIAALRHLNTADTEPWVQVLSDAEIEALTPPQNVPVFRIWEWAWPLIHLTNGQVALPCLRRDRVGRAKVVLYGGAPVPASMPGVASTRGK